MHLHVHIKVKDKVMGLLYSSNTIGQYCRQAAARSYDPCKTMKHGCPCVASNVQKGGVCPPKCLFLLPVTFFSFCNENAAYFQYSEGVRKCRTFFLVAKSWKMFDFWGFTVEERWDKYHPSQSLRHTCTNTEQQLKHKRVLLSECPHLYHVTSPDYNNRISHKTELRTWSCSGFSFRTQHGSVNLQVCVLFVNINRLQ